MQFLIIRFSIRQNFQIQKSRHGVQVKSPREQMLTCQTWPQNQQVTWRVELIGSWPERGTGKCARTPDGLDLTMQGAGLELAVWFSFKKCDLVLNFPKPGLAVWVHFAP